MEQMYLIEIFIDKVTVIVSDEDKSSAKKRLIIKIKFGPKVQFIVKEQQLAYNGESKDDIVECDENGKRKFSRTIRVGKSYLFPSYPDTILMILGQFPLEIEVWNDDENETEIFVGIGNMHWDTQFFRMLKDTAEPCKVHEPLSIKQNTPLYAECCCKRVGEIDFILRLSALGENIITEFQQLLKDPDSFVFRTDKAPSMFKCKRIEGDDPNFCMVGSLYETTTLEDPSTQAVAAQKIEICTELESCGNAKKSETYSCGHSENEGKKKYPIDKIRMGDITGPCKNTYCPLTHKVKKHIRNLDSYKNDAQSKDLCKNGKTTRKICGTCNCKDDRWHRDNCPKKTLQDKGVKATLCSGCGRIAKSGDTCDDKTNNMFGTGATSKRNKTCIAYVFNVTDVSDYKDAIYGRHLDDNEVMSYNFTVDTNAQAASLDRNDGNINTHIASVPNDITHPNVIISASKRLVRVIAFLRRFCFLKNSYSFSIHLPFQNAKASQDYCVRQHQSDLFADDIERITKLQDVNKRSQITLLNSFKYELLLIGSRNEHSDFPNGCKNPIIIFGVSNIDKLIITEAHEKLMYRGQHLSCKYVRNNRNCLSSVRNAANFRTQLMGQLPACRVISAKLFLTLGLDYDYVKNHVSRGRGHESYKGYIYIPLRLSLCTACFTVSEKYIPNF